MLWVLIIGGFIVAVCMLVLCPVLLFGSIVTVLCFVFNHPVAGVVIGIMTIIGQVTVGREFGIYGGVGGTSSGFTDYEDYDGDSDGFTPEELFVAHKINEHMKDKDD